jgi:CBS domain containing-hemolysin-like protein
LFLLCTVLFSPLAAVLWLLGRVLQSLVGEAPERLQLTLARNELQRVFVEGHEVGILTPAQRQLADGMFAVAQESILRFSVPPARMASVHLGAAKADVLRLARRHGASTFLVTEARGRKWIGYVRVVDLYLSPGDYIENPRPLLTVGVRESPIAALTRMQSAKEPVACVVDRKGEILGVVGVRELTEPLLRSAKAAGAFL